MIPKYLSEIGVAVAPALGNHLWQSTLCIVIAGLLAWVLRKNHARARYSLWLATSLKFLIPFSLLITLGTHLQIPRVVPRTAPLFFFAMEEVSQPFTRPAARVVVPLAHSKTLPTSVLLLPALLAAGWVCGFMVVLFVWFARWRRISAALRKAVPLREGREVEALRRAERLGGLPKRIELLLSPDTVEPGIFGIVKPVLIWPKGISEHLQDAHLEAILAHEVWHVRRRDNLAAMFHMLVEALFWFHPLVWWLAPRLVEERERACDEKVLELGSQRQVYAESILKTCEFCVRSPLACASGVTGSDLKKRIVGIMAERLASKLSFGRKLLLAILSVLVVVGPVVFGFMNAPRIRAQETRTTARALPSFEVASIKLNRSGDRRTNIMLPPGRFGAYNVGAKSLIALAYDIQPFQVSGGPVWINSEQYDIEAKMEASLAEKLQRLPFEERLDEVKLMVQSLLEDRFNLKVSHATKELPVYAMGIGKGGPKLHEAKPGDTYPNGIKGPDGLARPGMMRMVGSSDLTAQGVSMALLAQQLSHQLDRTVVDQTGLKSNYDFTLRWSYDEGAGALFKGPGDGRPATDNAPPPDTSGPSIFTAIQEQLGLKLESTKGPVDIIVIDHIERPSEN